MGKFYFAPARMRIKKVARGFIVVKTRTGLDTDGEYGVQLVVDKGQSQSWN